MEELRNRIWEQVIPALILQLSKTYGNVVGPACVPVAAKLLRIELSDPRLVRISVDPDAWMRVELTQTIQRIVEHQDVTDCSRTIRVSNSVINKHDLFSTEPDLEAFLGELWVFVEKKFESLTPDNRIHRGRSELAVQASGIALCRLFSSIEEANQFTANTIRRENYQFMGPAPVGNHFFIQACSEYSETLVSENGHRNVLANLRVQDWRSFLWNRFTLRYRDALDLVESSSLEIGVEEPIGQSTPGPGGEDGLLGDFSNHTKKSFLTEDSFNQFCLGMNDLQRRRTLLKITMYQLKMTAYISPDYFIDSSKMLLERSFSELENNYLEAQSLLNHCVNKKRDCACKLDTLAARLNLSSENAKSSGFFKEREISNFVIVGRGYYHDQKGANQDQNGGIEILRNQMQRIMETFRFNRNRRYLDSLNDLKSTLFDLAVPFKPVTALEERIELNEFLLTFAYAAFDKTLRKEIIELKVKQDACRHEEARIQFTKQCGPSNQSNLGRFNSFEKYSNTLDNSPDNQIVRDGVFWIRDQREIACILKMNSLLEDDALPYDDNWRVNCAIHHQTMISRYLVGGKSIFQQLAVYNLVEQGQLDWLKNDSIMEVAEKCFERFFCTAQNFEWRERELRGYQIETSQQFKNIEWLVGKFSKNHFTLEITTKEAERLLVDCSDALARIKNLTVIANNLSAQVRQ
jgi:hypothetical protein